MNKFIIRKVFCKFREMCGLKGEKKVSLWNFNAALLRVVTNSHRTTHDTIITNKHKKSISFSNKCYCDSCSCFSDNNKTVSPRLSVCARHRHQAPQPPPPPLPPVPLPLVVHRIVVQLSSEWSTRRGRTRDGISTPALYREKPSVTSLRWQQEHKLISVEQFIV